MIRKIAKPWNEIQLGFTFLSQEEERASSAREHKQREASKPKEVNAKAPDLGEALSLTHARLLDAPLLDVSSQLLPLLEFCEATLTRALDVVTSRETEPSFSGEEQRSLRGIGQAQWLITEKLAQRSARTEEKLTRRKKTMNDE